MKLMKIHQIFIGHLYFMEREISIEFHDLQGTSGNCMESYPIPYCKNTDLAFKFIYSFHILEYGYLIIKIVS